MSQSSLLSLPYQLLIDNILYYLDAASILSVRQASKACQQLADDEIIWRRRIAQDFNFPIFNSARISGWQRLYRGLSNPDLYTWGDWSNARIGRELGPRDLPPHLWNLIARVRGVPFPLQIEWKHAMQYLNDPQEWNEELRDEEAVDEDYPFEVKVKKVSEGFMGIPIQIYAGGWSFFALTDQGQILAWGQSSEMFFNNTEFKTPVMLDLCGYKAKSLSVGRAHAVAVMNDGALWEWSKRWDEPIILDKATLFGKVSEDDVSVIQVDAGWDITACLAHVRPEEEDKNKAKKTPSTRIVFWKTDHSYLHSRWHIRPPVEDIERTKYYPDKHTLTAINLPLLDKEVIKIAAGDNFVLALTKDHAVYVCSFPALPANFDVEYRGIVGIRPEPNLIMPDNERDSHAWVNKVNTFYANLINRGQVEWKPLAKFGSDLRSSGLRKDGSNVWDDLSLAHLVNTNTKVTHISAQFNQFAVYAPDAGKDHQDSTSRGIVVLGKSSNFKEAIVIPQLQGQEVIKVSQGDWHSGALTLDGRVLTWGEQSKGALGSWDSLPVQDHALSTLEPIHRPPPQRTGIFRFFNGQSAPGDTNTEDALTLDEMSQMTDAEKRRYKYREIPQSIIEPLPVRFGFPKIGEQRQGSTVSATDDIESKYVFDIAFAGWHSGALAIDRNLISETN